MSVVIPLPDERSSARKLDLSLPVACTECVDERERPRERNRPTRAACGDKVAMLIGAHRYRQLAGVTSAQGCAEVSLGLQDFINGQCL